MEKISWAMVPLLVNTTSVMRHAFSTPKHFQVYLGEFLNQFACTYRFRDIGTAGLLFPLGLSVLLDFDWHLLCGLAYLGSMEERQMHEQHGGTQQGRVEFRVVCADENGTPLVWKYAETLEDALYYLKNLDHKYQTRRPWFIYEAHITEIIRMVYTLNTQTGRDADNPDAD